MRRKEAKRGNTGPGKPPQGHSLASVFRSIINNKYEDEEEVVIITSILLLLLAKMRVHIIIFFSLFFWERRAARNGGAYRRIGNATLGWYYYLGELTGLPVRGTPLA